MSNGLKSQLERAAKDQSWKNLSAKINNIVLAYNPKYRTNITCISNDTRQ